MNSSKSKTLLYSTLGVGLVFVALFGANLIFSPARVRVDLTADKLYTLSAGTKRILEKVRSSDTDVTVSFYVSQKANRLPSYVEPLARNTEDLLNEFKAQAGGRLVVKKLDPEPDSETEDAAKLDGIEPLQNPQTGEPYYLGVVVNLDPGKAVLPAITPDSDRLLEYNLSRAISQVLQTTKPVIGVMSSLQVNGGFNPMAMQGGGPRQTDPWVAISELKRDFDVQNVGMDSDKIDDKVKVLIVIHPKDITDKAQYALDQFVLRGGRLIALLDANCRADTRGANNQMGINFGAASTLPKLLKAWGLEFDISKIVADREFTRQLNFGRGPQWAPAYMWLNKKGINQDDAIFAQTDNLLMPFVGAFTGKPADGLKMETILKSTSDAQLVDGLTADLNGSKTMDDFAPSGVVYSLAVRLTGKFKTAFPEGKPGDPKTPETDKDKKETPAPSGDQLKESSAENTVYLFGDSDFIYDQFCVQIDRMFRVATPFNGNLPMFQNLVEQMAGDANLIGSRSRASVRRPFTVVQEMQAAANKKFQAEIAGFQKKVEESQTKISQIQSKKEGNQKFILAPEAAVELKKLQETQAAANKDLRRVRRELSKDIDSMENRFKWINIALMPFLVTAAGIAFAFSRRSKTAAK